jgi:hypothetical protein
MPSSNWIRAIVVLAAAIWAGILILQGVNLEGDWLKPLGGVIGVVTLLVLGFDRFAWRWPGVQRLSGRRLVRGTWRGELVSDWVDPDSGQTREPIPVYLAVEQTYSDVRLTLMTAESKSTTLTAALDNPARSECTLSGIYLNTPGLLQQETSPIHYGGMLLDVCGNPAGSLEGSYWTSRGTKGQMIFDVRSTKLFESFAAAERGEFS